MNIRNSVHGRFEPILILTIRMVEKIIAGIWVADSFTNLNNHPIFDFIPTSVSGIEMWIANEFANLNNHPVLILFLY